MKLSEKVEAITVALELFPRCARCGEILDPTRLTALVQVAGRPNRHAHIECPNRATRLTGRDET